MLQKQTNENKDFHSTYPDIKRTKTQLIVLLSFEEIRIKTEVHMYIHVGCQITFAHMYMDCNFCA